MEKTHDGKIIVIDKFTWQRYNNDKKTWKGAFCSMNKEKILESSRRENKNRDLAEMEVTAQAGNIAGRVGATVCVVLTLIFRIFTKTYFLSPWVVYFSILTTHTLVKYASLKRKTDLILGILYLAMCLTFLAFFVLRLVEVKE